VSDSSDPEQARPEDFARGDVAPDETPEFTKEPQPELSLELRKKKAGWNWNRFIIWLAVGGFAIYLIVTGIVGILTKAR
jgi:hypothetical protein